MPVENLETPPETLSMQDAKAKAVSDAATQITEEIIQELHARGKQIAEEHVVANAGAEVSAAPGPIARPSVGRIVHYYDGRNSEPRAAIVLSVVEDSPVMLATLAVFTPGDERVGTFANVWYGEAGEPGVFWTWPPRA